MTAGKAPSGREIWKAVREELVLNLYALPFSTIAPTVYHVYLHPEDFDAIEGISGTLTEQIRQALTEEVTRLNRDMGGRVKTIMARLLERDRLAPVEIPPGGWEVNLRRDPDGELARGQLGIVSTLAMPAPVEYGGTPTTRIVRSIVGASGRAATVSHVPQQAGSAVPGAAMPSDGGVRETEGRSSPDRARLTYSDDQGAHTFMMRKDTVSIGRGGSAVWVDVQVITTARVSREHVRIRGDASGGFFVQDVSLWGTTVDGAPIPPAVKGPEGVAQPGPEQPLPARARIGLADAITIDFEALGAP
ncbi:hypothetical protein LuPra_01849 [Luteitalea pratensis]|uniref:FHA domain-containing protein n=1 Tax=Luteitalea pratensis TaxID=1855912 RepID=A0A143PJA7_LUTPR|nr:FhaA domain-containing protein [Luteitalea pratensis]AMY08645.1 hypothetical protein LuPra_01849 [Luteitalea pratensis]